MTTAVRLTDTQEKRLSRLVAKTHRTKSFYIKTALDKFLDEHEDYLLAVDALEKHTASGGKTLSLEEITRKYNLE